MTNQKKDITMKEKNTETDKKAEEYLEKWLKEQFDEGEREAGTQEEWEYDPEPGESESEEKETKEQNRKKFGRKRKRAKDQSTSQDFRKGKKSPKRFGKKEKNNQLIRIEELQELMAKYGDDIDPEKIVSMYRPHRRRRQIGAALLRLDRLQLALLGMLLVVCILFITAFMQEKMGNFTINLDRLELYRKGISIADNGNFDQATAKLTAASVEDATNISIDDLPDNLDEEEGTHNGKNYMAYTYYVRNAGKEDLGYVASITLDSCAKGAEDAVRVAVWRNGDRVVYAEPSKNGDPEAGCTNFTEKNLVCRYEEKDFLVGNVDRYTIVIWMEGDDPECVDKIIGGSVEFSMHIDADSDDQSSLLWKFITDIKDTLTGNKPISAAGNDVPNDAYYTDQDITWENRRNK